MSKKRDNLFGSPEELRTPLDELEVLAELSGTVYFQVLKRVARRYAENLKNLSFSLREEDPQFAIKHTRYVEQAVGMQLLIKAINDAKKEVEAVESANEDRTPEKE
jgi:hypothetical protein